VLGQRRRINGSEPRTAEAPTARYRGRPGIIKIGANLPISRRPRMNEEVLNTSLRKFLKVVGVTSQREIENAIRKAVEDGRLKGNEALSAQVVLTIDKAGLNHKIDGTIELE
jgi:hypothetical protein